MDPLTTIAIGRYTIDVGVATTHDEREAVLAQRLRVYQREGYYREALPRIALQAYWPASGMIPAVRRIIAKRFRSDAHAEDFGEARGAHGDALAG